jgi:hypothetical protein
MSRSHTPQCSTLRRWFCLLIELWQEKNKKKTRKKRDFIGRSIVVQFVVVVEFLYKNIHRSKKHPQITFLLFFVLFLLFDITHTHTSANETAYSNYTDTYTMYNVYNNKSLVAGHYVFAFSVSCRAAISNRGRSPPEPPPLFIFFLLFLFFTTKLHN